MWKNTLHVCAKKKYKETGQWGEKNVFFQKKYCLIEKYILPLQAE